MPSDPPSDERLEFWNEIRKLIDDDSQRIAFVVFKMKHGVDLQIADLNTISLLSTMLIIYDEQDGQTMVDARNIYSAYVALKD